MSGKGDKDNRTTDFTSRSEKLESIFGERDYTYYQKKDDLLKKENSDKEVSAKDIYRSAY